VYDAAVPNVAVAVCDEYHLNNGLDTSDTLAVKVAVVPEQIVFPFAVIVASVANGLTVIFTVLL
jgi:hypothetical protein